MKKIHLSGRGSGGDESGSVLLIALLVMIAISVLGVLGIQSSIVELDLVRNERDIQEAFHLSESAALEGIELLVNSSKEDRQDNQPVWHHARKTMEALNCDLRDMTQWDADGQGQDDNSIKSKFSQESLIAAVEWDVAAGGSLVMTQSRLIVTRVYGLCTKHNAGQLIEIGYAMRY